MNLTKIAWRNIGRHKRRSFLCGLSIFVASAAIVFFFSMEKGISADMAQNLQSYYSGQIRIRDSQFDKNENLMLMQYYVKDQAQVLTELKTIQGISEGVSRIRIPSKIWKKGNQESDVPAIGFGLDFEPEKQFMKIDKALILGKLPQESSIDKKTGRPVYQVALAKGLADRLNAGVGDRVTIFYQNAGRASNSVTLQVTGILKFSLSDMNHQYYFIPLNTAGKLMKMEGGASEVLLKINEGTDGRMAISLVQKELEKIQRTELNPVYWLDIPGLFSFMQVADKLYFFIGLIFFLLSSTVMINTVIMVILERMHEIGILGSLGLKGREIRILFFLESLYISAIGAFAGVIMGALITYIFSKTGMDFSSMMDGIEMDVSGIIYPKLDVQSLFIVFIFGVTVASLTSFIPTRRASKIKAVDALKSL